MSFVEYFTRIFTEYLPKKTKGFQEDKVLLLAFRKNMFCVSPVQKKLLSPNKR